MIDESVVPSEIAPVSMGAMVSAELVAPDKSIMLPLDEQPTAIAKDKIKLSFNTICKKRPSTPLYAYLSEFPGLN